MKFPQLSFGGQLIALLLAALVVAQALSFVVFTDDRAAGGPRGRTAPASSRAWPRSCASSRRRRPRTRGRAGRGRLARPASATGSANESAMPDGRRIGQVDLPVVQFERLLHGPLRESPRLVVIDGDSPRRSVPACGTTTIDGEHRRRRSRVSTSSSTSLPRSPSPTAAGSTPRPGSAPSRCRSPGRR